MQSNEKSAGTIAGDLSSRDDQPSGWSRREFVGGLAALAGGQLHFGNALAQTSGSQRRSIDVHHHFNPQSYADFLRRHNMGRADKWTLQADLEDMDAGGTATAMLSITNPGFGAGHIEDSRAAARGANEAAAKLKADHRGRFGSFAALPLTDTEGSLREIEYALDTLKAEGIYLFTNYGDKWLGDSSFAPVYEELNRRKAVIYVHPANAICCSDIGKTASIPGYDAMVEFGTNTTRAIAAVIFSGTTTRYPDITWIWSHAGGTMPFLIERFLAGSPSEIIQGVVTRGIETAAPPKNVPGGVLHEIRKMYYDTAQTSNPVAMGALHTCVGTSQIVFGTDYSFRTAVYTAHSLETCKVFNAKELRAVFRGNAERILPRRA